MANESPLLRVPAEIRLMIYGYLLNDGGNSCLSVRSMKEKQAKALPGTDRRSRYHVVESRSWHRKCYETTYYLDTDNVVMHTAIMAVNRQIHEETSHMLYGRHSFNFGSDIEAVIPFFSDRTPSSRSVITEIAVTKRAPTIYFTESSERWAHMFRYLGVNSHIQKLRLTVGGGAPQEPWEGPQELTESDFKLLSVLGHDIIDWVAEMPQLKGLRELEILPHLQFAQTPKSQSMSILAAFSASIELGFAGYLREKLGLDV